MSSLRSRSNSSEKNEDSVKRDQRSNSIADEFHSEVKVTTIYRSQSNSPHPVNKSKSRSRSRSRPRSRSGRSRRDSGSKRRSRSSSRRSRGHRRPRSKDRYRSKSRSRSRRRDDSRDGGGYRLHVADINEECRKRDLERLFTKYGPLKEIWLASYAPFYAFIVFRTKRDAETACSRANGASISGRRIRVSMAKPRNVGPRNRFIAGRRRSGDRCTRY